MKFQKRLLRAEPNFQILTKLWQVNWLYVLLICALAVVGYGALYSAGGGTPRPFAGPQSIRFCFGLVMMLGLALMSPGILVRMAWPLYIFSILLLVAVLRMGHVGKGAERWIMLGGIQVQPSELAKIALVLMLASWFHKISYRRMGNPLLLVPPALMVLLPVALVLKEPNLGTAVIIGTVGASMFFGAGMRLWQIALVVLPVPFLARIAYGHLHDYQKARVTTFLHPESDPLGAGYNIIQSKIALFGRHVGAGLPAGHAGAAQLPAGKADRFHLHHDCRGMGVRRRYHRHRHAAFAGVRRHADRHTQPQPVRAAARAGHFHELLSLLRGQPVHGDGRDPGGGRTAAAHFLWGVGHAYGDVRLRAAHVRMGAPQRDLWRDGGGGQLMAGILPPTPGVHRAYRLSTYHAAGLPVIRIGHRPRWHGRAPAGDIVLLSACNPGGRLYAPAGTGG